MLKRIYVLTPFLAVKFLARAIIFMSNFVFI